jgi:urea transport system permease protein
LPPKVLLEGLIGGLFNGISIGAVLLIVALGLAIVFGLMGVINLAHGELMMFGAYTTFVVQNVAKSMGGMAPEIYIFAALPLAFLVAAAIGLFLERTVIRYLYGRPLETLLGHLGRELDYDPVHPQRELAHGDWFSGVRGAVFHRTLGADPLHRLGSDSGLGQSPVFGLSGAIAVLTWVLVQGAGSAQFVRPWFGARNVDVTPPSWLRGGVALGTTLQFPYARLFIIALTILCLVAVYWFLNGTAWGLRIRSVTQNRGMSACLGIPTDQVDALTFALGSGLAGIAGCAVTLWVPWGQTWGPTTLWMPSWWWWWAVSASWSAALWRRC